MQKLIFIDSCMREESRTKRIATPIIAELSKRYEVERIALEGASYPAVDSKTLQDRNNGIVPEHFVDLAKKVAAADRIVIAAPFWDMSFPAILKLFIENLSLFGVTFNSDDKTCYGLCRCQKLLYITTRGMNISTGDPLEQATPYLKALSFLWGLGEIVTISAQNLDYSSPEEIEDKISLAIESGLNLCKDF
ncbi:MAG: NAD(P)H-dependent oxidoreductase [Bacteroidales bacterium]|nr:NAD(P)H-dependent oxidoreductase [Bacteroidales bacterium]